MRFISADDLDRLLDPVTLRQHLDEAFRQEIDVPSRHHHAIGNAVHLLMPAWTAGTPGAGQFLGTKIVNIVPDNAGRGLPTVTGSYLLQSGESGMPLALIDGTRLTHLRTAAVSALASHHVSRPDARRLLMVGAGAMAPFLVAAHAAARPIDEVAIWNRDPARAERLTATLARPGLKVTATRDLASAVAAADIVSCATLSQSPLVLGEWLRAGQHVDLVGAFTLAMREVDDEALRRAELFVDTDHALREGGDVAIGLQTGTIRRDQVAANLQDLCRGMHAGRSDADAITLFKSVGTAAADLAAAVLAYQRC